MILEDLRCEIIKYLKLLRIENLTSGTGGNISAFDEESKLFAISPSGMDYFSLEPEDIVVMDLDGNVIDSDRRPSSELEIHRLLYKHRNFKAIVHCHSIYASALATLRLRLPAMSYLVADFGSKSVEVCEYETFGTVELAKSCLRAIEGSKACLMANHGQLTAGKNLSEAFSLAQRLEELSKIYLIARSAGEVCLISDEKMDEVLKKFAHYGQQP